MTRKREDETAIKKLANDWGTGWDNHDAEALISLFTDDPIVMPHSQPVVIGKDAIRSLYQSVFAEYKVEGMVEVVEIEISGDLGYFWCNYTLTATPRAGGAPINEKGKSIFIVRRQDDNSWKIARLIDNSDQPTQSYY